MSFDLTKLSDYAKDNADVLVTRAITGSKTAALITREGNLLTGIKTKERIGQFDTDLVVQDGTTCGWSPSGTTKISQREIEVGTMAVMEPLCQKDLDRAYTQLKMQNQGANSQELPADIEEKFTQTKVRKIEAFNERLLWQGDKTKTGDANLKWADGFLTHIDGDDTAITVNAKRGTGTITSTTGSTAVNGTSTKFSSQVAAGDKLYSEGVLIGTVQTVNSDTSITLTANGAAAVTAKKFTIGPAAAGVGGSIVLASTGITLTNVMDVFDEVYAAIPVALLSNQSVSRIYIFAGNDLCRTYLRALVKANLFHYQAQDTALEDGFVLPGTNIKVLPTTGLDSTNRIVATHIQNMWLGTDLENEFEDFEMWFSKDNGEMRFRCAWRLGDNFAFMDEVVQFLLAA
jgi:hypothetical protein